VLSNPGEKPCHPAAPCAHGRDGRRRREGLAQAATESAVFFSIHGTGEEEAVKLVRDELGIEPYDFMEDAIQAAVKAAQ
jgi:hypothetical protein